MVFLFFFFVIQAKQIAGIAVNKLAKNAGIALHILEPIADLKSSGGPSGTVVGKFEQNLRVLAC